jgi:RIO-like serine/threonine protein kinase
VYEAYFQQITESLDSTDLMVLNYLKSMDATIKFKAIRNTKLQEEVGFTDAQYRKTITRLTSIKFVKVNTTNKEHALFITEYGDLALNAMLQKAQ